MRWPWSSSLTYPLTAVLVGFAVIPLALVGWGFVSSNRDQVETLEKKSMTKQAVGTALEIQLFFLESVGRIETIASALRPKVGEVIDKGSQTEVLANLVRKNQNIIVLRLIDGSGEYIQLPDSIPAKTEEVITPILAGAFRANLTGEVIKENLIRLANGQPMALVSIPLLAVDGRITGALQGAVSLESIVANLGGESGKGSTVDIVDMSGKIVFSSERTRWEQDANANPLVIQFRQAPVRLTKTYNDPLRLSKDEVLGSLCPVGNPPWAVIAARDVDVAFATVRGMARRATILGVAAGVVAILAGVFLARTITKPVRNLAAVTTAVAQGDFARRAPVTSRNELGRLAANFNSMSGEIERYIISLRRALAENQQLLIDSIRALAAAIDAKNPYTRGHSEHVSKYAVAIAKHIGISGPELMRVEIAALLHDVGKIGIEDAILLKPDVLTDAEFAAMRSHPVKGAAIVSSIGKLKDVLPGIRSHHESWDGSGYPEGLAGERIPLLARIIATADVFDAMTTNRPYQHPMPLEIALVRMHEIAGRRLDPRVVDAFFSALAVGDLMPLGEVEVA
jgi:putative nucleotidyltransferase with HDIG domain